MSYLNRHNNYKSVQEAAEKCLENERHIAGLPDEVILLARLYAYAFRGQVIGAFHATAAALLKIAGFEKVPAEIQKSVELLQALGTYSKDPIPSDRRAVLGSFYRYHQGIALVMDSIDRTGKSNSSIELRTVQQFFVQALERITCSSGIFITRDDEIPEQASFIVPSLGITIVPLIYGDHHSWNMAYLSGSSLDVPRHLHSEGVEIHLGSGELRGETCLGNYRTAVTEGYAMPIPPATPHGFINHAGREHRLPFIFGSRRLGGWGIVPDVTPSPINLQELVPVELRSKEMNGSIFLDREIESAARATGCLRKTLISRERTFSRAAGGLCLSLTRIENTEKSFKPERFQIVSVVSGRGRVVIGSASAAIFPHIHFGIPSGAQASISASDGTPLILLDALHVE